MFAADRREKIIQLITERPNMRDMEIADRLDLDVEQVGRALADDINSGKVLVAQVRAPNGRMVDTYRIHGAAEPQSAPVKTKEQAAIDYLREVGGRVPPQFLARAMGLPKAQHPSAYLQSAIAGGRIIYRDREFWLPEFGGAQEAPAAVAMPAPKPANVEENRKPDPAPAAVTTTAGIVTRTIAREEAAPAPAIAAADMPDIDVPVTRKLVSEPVTVDGVAATLKTRAAQVEPSAAPEATPAPAVWARPKLSDMAAQQAASTAQEKPQEAAQQPAGDASAEKVEHITTEPAAAPAELGCAPSHDEPAQEQPAEPAALVLDEAKFRFGLFSDGELVIQHGSHTVILPRKQTRALRRYLDAMPG